MEDCIFCKIVRKEAPAAIEFENDSVIAFKSIFPVAQTHVLIVSKTHVATFMDLDDKSMVDLKNAAMELINKLKIGEAYKLVVNGGKYQAVPHFHWHLLAGKLENENDILNKT